VTAPQTKTPKRRSWWVLPVAAVVVGGMIAVAVAMTTDDERAAGPSSGTIGDPEIRQSKWKISTKRASGKRLSKEQRAALKRQKGKLSALTKDVFDALFLSPELQSKALKSSFQPEARKSYQRAGAGVPKGADEVQIRRRTGRIVIEGNARAIINVRIVARGQAPNGEFSTEHRSVLYAARGNSGWKVFGFVMDQGPFKKKARPSQKDDEGKKDQGPRNKDKKDDKGSDGQKNKNQSGGKGKRGDRR
jgi:hypothetical protein